MLLLRLLIYESLKALNLVFIELLPPIPLPLTALIEFEALLLGDVTDKVGFSKPLTYSELLVVE